ncbi:His/Gly/Thr/Pro-type tRNA ligase C-terminal domain-containing protein [Prescottella defluvii]|nr:His/Gly/Thr/Pro-type tRNA ligase C-terminal domain-containing protein [Prescottella defluvii]
MDRCNDLGLRAHAVDRGDGTLGARIRSSRRVPYQAVIGAEEAANGHVALRLRDGRRIDSRPVDDVLRDIVELIGVRSTDLWKI